jgi:hypothetical protein
MRKVHRVDLRAYAPIPQEWLRICAHLGIKLDSESLEIAGGLEIDGHPRSENEATKDILTGLGAAVYGAKGPYSRRDR